MPLDEEFIVAARQHFNPYLPDSGTELVAPLLYWLARMLRPRTVVEYGSGYSTLFILRALADNIDDIQAEQRNLRAKTQGTRLFERWSVSTESLIGDPWLGAGEVACGVDPAFYLQRYTPHLFSFEQLPGDHEYAKHMRGAVAAIGHESLFTHICGQSFCKDALPSGALPIDWAWNDDDRYVDFFSEFWESLNPSGGLMIFHNPAGWIPNYETIRSIVQQRAPHGDLECLLLEEPHKLSQNGCAILRRTTHYQPRFALSRPQEVLQALQTLMPA